MVVVWEVAMAVEVIEIMEVHYSYAVSSDSHLDNQFSLLLERFRATENIQQIEVQHRCRKTFKIG